MYLHSTSPNFKSHIKENNCYKAAVKSAQNDLNPQGFHQRGMNTLKAIEGLSFNNKHDFVEFFQNNGKVYTKINGAIDEKRTFPAQNSYGVNAQYAIIQYAQSIDSFSDAPLTEQEKRVIALEKELSEAEELMRKDYQKRLKRYI